MPSVGKQSDDCAIVAPVRSPRRWIATTLVVVATVLAFVSILALWANRQFLNTDNWTKTSSQLLQREAIRTQVADFLVDQLYAHVNIRGEIESALPPQAKALAGPAAGGLRNALEKGIDQLLQRPKVQQLWENANRLAHQQLLATLEGGGKNVSTTGGNVTLNLGQVAASAASAFGLGNVASKIPPNAAQITILKSKQLDAVQSALQALRGISLIVLILTFLLYIVAVVVARERRRETLRMVGGSLIVAGALALVARYFAGQEVVNALSSTASVRTTVSDTWEISSSLLVEAAQSAIAYGVVVVLGAWLAGPTRPAVAVRHFLAPFLHSPRWAFGSVAVVVLLILLWGPTPATRKPLGMLIFAILLCLGVEVLRRQVKREVPNASFGELGTHVQERWRRMRARVPSRSAPVEEAPPVGAPAREVKLDELERLGRLRETGVLTDEEFEQQKASILAGSAG